ncbi:MAG: hypothetical protein NT013_21040 [Planctomycetia bacterium]|nr:hypothetical protein [Planctomycetia bacterium]
MPEPILVRGGVSKTMNVFRVLAALAALGGVLVLLFGDSKLGVILCVAGGGLWIVLEVSSAVLRARREWVEDTGEGFVHTDRRGDRTFDDEHVIGIAFEQRKLFSNGVAKQIQRACRLWTIDEPQPIELLNKFPLAAADPLAELIRRLMKRVHLDLETSLKQKEPIEGDGWWMDGNTFYTTSNRVEVSVPISDLTECAVFDNQMSLWRRGQDDAFAKFPAGSQNACLLPLLLAEQLQRESEKKDTEDGPGLGRILFERRAKKITRVILALVAFVLSLASVGMLFDKDPGLKIIGGILLVLAVGALYSSFAIRRSFFRCQQRGVMKVSLFSERPLKFAETGSFTYSATRHYHNGAYVGTNINMKFDPLLESNARSISYNTSVQGEDASLEELRDFISRAIAGRMAKRLNDGKTVKWTNNLTFVAGGLEYRPGGFLGRKPAVTLPYSEYHGYGLDQGTFSIFRTEVKKAVMTESASAPNFFPGFYLLQLLLHIPNPTQEATNAGEPVES